jgi:hypothetical protein
MTSAAKLQASEAQELFNALVVAHGGVPAFDAAQVEICRTIVGLMLDLRTCPVGESVKIADTMSRLMDRLPPRVPPRPRGEISTIGMGLQALSALYSRLIGGAESNGEDSAPTEPAYAPEPAPATHATTALLSRPATPSVPDLAEPVEPSAPSVEMPPDERLRITTFWSIGAQPVSPPPEPASEPIEPAPTPDPRLRAFGRTVYSGAG